MKATPFAFGFRIFFASCAAYAVAVMAAWIGVFTFGWGVAGSRPVAWHAHEMIHGVAAAAIAGFLLTAVPNWTATTRLHGTGLLALWLLWLAGRAGYWLVDPFAGGALSGLVRLTDLAFLPVLAVVIARPLIAAGNRRNLVMVALLAGLFATNLIQTIAAPGRQTTVLALDLLLVMMIIIGGRIAPLFTRNWLKRRGDDPDLVRTHPWLDAASIGLVAATAGSALFGAAERTVATVALAAGLANLARLAEWQGWRAWRDPLVWVLHLGYAWIVVAFVLRGVAGHTTAIHPVVWMHAAGVGAMGTLILGVMARATLGHTGRDLRLPAGAWTMFALITIAAVARTGNALGWLDHGISLTLAGLAWIAAFGTFAVVFFPKLFAPRIDGREG